MMMMGVQGSNDNSKTKNSSGGGDHGVMISKKCHRLLPEDLETTLSIIYSKTNNDNNNTSSNPLIKLHVLDECLRSMQPPAVVWRKKIISWMYDASSEFKMDIETVAVAITLMDSYLIATSKTKIEKLVLQLLAMVSLSVASKMHESLPMTMEEMILLCRGQFSKMQIVAMERALLQLSFNNGVLTFPTGYDASNVLLLSLLQQDAASGHLTNQNNIELSTHSMLKNRVQELIKTSLLDYGFYAYTPLEIAVAAVNVASREVGGVDSNNNSSGESFTIKSLNANTIASIERAFETGLHVAPVDTTGGLNSLFAGRSTSPTSAEELERMLAMQQHHKKSLKRKSPE